MDEVLEPSNAPLLALPQAVPARPGNRARGELAASFALVGGRTTVARTHQAGGLRLRFPNVTPGLMPGCEAVTINTAGGMMGGDTARLAFTLDPGTAVTVTSQSAEKIHRSTGTATTVDTRLHLGAGALAEWLPQETILFDAAAFHRSLEVDLAPDASLLLVEGIVFGRLAMGEVVRSGLLHDRWRIRRGGHLVFAEAVALEGAIVDHLDRPALGHGARAIATLLLVAPTAEGRLALVRDVLAGYDCAGGASAWNGMLVVRLLAPSPERVRAAIVGLLAALRGRTAPRVWQ